MINDRCDIEFTYKTTNDYLNYIVGIPTYFVNAGNKFSITLKNISPKKVTFKTNSHSLDLINTDNTWSNTIPDSYTSRESFSIVLNENVILYQGLLNYPMTNINDLETQVSVNTEDISLLKMSNQELIENFQNYSSSMDLRVKDLEEKVDKLIECCNKNN